MEKITFLYFDGMKKVNIENISEDLKAWKKKNPDVTISKMAKNTGLSESMIKLILNYGPEKEKPNPSLDVLGRILEMIGCEWFYTPKHDVK